MWGGENVRNGTEAGLRNDTMLEEPESERIMTIMAYTIPAIVSLGSLGNLLSILVFFTTKLRKLSSSYYLSALAVSDTGFLFCTLMTYLVTLDIGFYNEDGVCQITTYLAQVFGFLSPWFIVAFTVERFIAVRYPLKRTSMCTVSRAKAVLVALTLLAFAVCLPSLFISGIVAKQHNITEVRRDFSTRHIGWEENENHPIYLSEDMSPMNRRLYYLARQRKAAGKVKYVWFSGGRVRCRRDDGQPVVFINSPDDLETFA